MISQEQIDEIRRLLAGGTLSQRQISVLTGVSRGTIGSVASGKRIDRRPRPNDDWDVAEGPIVRCPGCGGRVHSPCRLCRIRELKTAEQADRRQRADRDFPAGNDGRPRPNDADSRTAARRRY